MSEFIRKQPAIAALAEGPAPTREDAAQEPAERRRWPRRAFTASAEVIEPVSHARIQGRCSDLGLGGCYVDAISPFPVGTDVLLHLKSGQRKFESHAVVIYGQAGMGMGLSFRELQPEQRAVLEDWINGHTSSSHAPAGDAVAEPLAREPDLEVPDWAIAERLVLNQLINLLIRKRVLTATEGATLLSELFRSS